MNFVLHHHLATTDLGSPVAGVGAMLPDVWRMVDRGVRPRTDVQLSEDDAVPEDAVPDDAGPEVRRLLAGVEHHLQADEVFHRHAAFVEGERRLTRAFRRAEIGAEKIGLFAHVAWELCLDGALLRRRGTDEILEELQRGVERAAGEALERTVRAHRDELPDAFDRRLEELLERIAWSDWVPGYAHGEGLADRLSGVRRRIGLAPLAGDDRRRVAGVLEEALDDAGPMLDAFLADWPAHSSI